MMMIVHLYAASTLLLFLLFITSEAFCEEG